MPQHSESDVQSRNFAKRTKQSRMTLQRILPSTALLLLLSLSGCGGGGGSGSGRVTNVYIGGATGVATGHNTYESVATYWRNGTATKLTDGISYAGASAIAVDSSGNVYAAGYTTSATTGEIIATYWKNGAANNIPTHWQNGTATNLPNGAACGCALASGIALSSH